MGECNSQYIYRTWRSIGWAAGDDETDGVDGWGNENADATENTDANENKNENATEKEKEEIGETMLTRRRACRALCVDACLSGLELGAEYS